MVPIFNEEQGLPELFKVLEHISSELNDQDVALEVIAVDNHSQDATWIKLCSYIESNSNFEMVAVQHPVNLGMQQSLLTGIKNSTGDSIAVLQSDLQDPPELIPLMVSKWKDGSKFVASKIEKRKGSLFPRVGAWGFYRLMSVVSDTKVIPDLSDFYLFDASLKTALINDSGTTPFIRTSLSAIQKPDFIFRYQREDREVGNSNFNLTKRINFAVDALIRNLGGIVKKLILLAVIVGFVSISGLLILLISYITGYRSPVNGWVSSTALLLLILSAVMIIGATTLEILSRIYREIPRTDYSAKSLVVSSSDFHQK